MTHRRFASNKLEVLFEELKLQLLSSKPFTPKIIIVPSQRIKIWTQKQIAEDSRFGVAMGLRFMGLMPAMECLANKDLFISESTLTFNIEGEIHHILHSASTQEMQPLFDYAKAGNQEKRIRHLAEHLARSFVTMARYGGTFLRKWLKQPGWKQEIWKKILKTNIYDTFELKTACEDVQVHLFGATSIPPLYMRLLDQYQGSLNHYILSPCQVFWGDIVSDQARLAFFKDEQDLAMDQFLQDRNPLLANWGCKLSFKQLEDDTVIESYQTSSQSSLLQQLQNAILNSDSKACFTRDHSLCVHAVYNKQREIEILKDVCIHLSLQKSIDPSGILVLAPNINDYVPFIQKVFGNDCPFNFAIEDVGKARDSVFLKAVIGLVNLAKSRFTPSDVLEFFSNPCVRKRCNIQNEDLKYLEKWAEECGVCFGLDKEHRHELLALPGIEDTMLETTNRGTWEYAFDGLLAGLAILPEESEPASLWPLDFVENSIAESLGRWIRLLSNIKRESKKRPISEWKQWFQSFVLDFIHPSEDERGYEDFTEALQSLNALEKYGFAFDSFWERLRSKIESKTHAIHGNDLNAVRFCSLKTGRAHPASLIWCLGLQDGAYPRLPLANPVDEMGQKGDRYPTHADEDRHLFLELLISARDAFYISYISHAPSDGKPQGPSTLVEELQDYVGFDLAYHHPKFAFDPAYFSLETQWPSYDLHNFSILAGNNKRTAAHLIPQFFGQHLSIPTAEQLTLRTEVDLAALAMAPRYKEDDEANSEEFGEKEDAVDWHLQQANKIRYVRKVGEQVEIQMSDLVGFAKNPLAHFLKKRIGVYLEYDEEDREFHLSKLQRFLMQKQFLHKTELDAVQSQKKSGQFPLGRFGDIASRHMEAYRSNLSEKLTNFGINFSDLFSLQLDKSDVKRFYITEEALGLHALTLSLTDEKTVVIHGDLDNITTEGPLVQAKSNLVGKVRNWPNILIPIVLDVCKPQALFLDDGKAIEIFDAKEALKKYVEYYLRAQSDPSPLITPWIGGLLGESSFQSVTDPYAIWALNVDKMMSEVIKQHWSKDLNRVFDGNI